VGDLPRSVVTLISPFTLSRKPTAGYFSSSVSLWTPAVPLVRVATSPFSESSGVKDSSVIGSFLSIVQAVGLRNVHRALWRGGGLCLLVGGLIGRLNGSDERRLLRGYGWNVEQNPKRSGFVVRQLFCHSSKLNHCGLLQLFICLRIHVPQRFDSFARNRAFSQVFYDARRVVKCFPVAIPLGHFAWARPALVKLRLQGRLLGSLAREFAVEKLRSALLNGRCFRGERG
jgi:hypothetical protein